MRKKKNENGERCANEAEDSQGKGKPPPVETGKPSEEA